MAEIDAGPQPWELAVSDAMWRADQGRRAEAIAGDLASVGVDGVALSYVDNAGVTRVKTVPVARLAHAAAWGVGMSPVFDVFCVDDSITAGRLSGWPT
jgi:glutamine synthetase